MEVLIAVTNSSNDKRKHEHFRVGAFRRIVILRKLLVTEHVVRQNIFNYRKYISRKYFYTDKIYSVENISVDVSVIVF